MNAPTIIDIRPSKLRQDSAKREAQKCDKRLHRLMAQAMTDFDMVRPHDKVMVCVSGGKDSQTLLHLLLNLQKRTTTPFELVAFNLDQGHPGFPAEVLPNHFTRLGVPYHIAQQDTYSTVKAIIPEGKTQCSLCSRLRRGVIYRVAKELGATKIALGHHRDDALATFFLNLFYGSKLKAMSAKLRSDDGHNTIIRPLIYADEDDCAHYAQAHQLPIIPCDLCGSQPQLQRAQMKTMLEAWRKNHPGRLDNIFRALGDINPHALYDKRLMNASIEHDDQQAAEEDLGIVR